MTVRWTRRATRRLSEVHGYISKDSAEAADRLVRRIGEVTQHLQTHPLSGREGRVATTRELVIAGTPYIVVYRVVSTMVQVVSLLHGKQQWPKSF